MKINLKKIEIQNFRSIQDKVELNINKGLFSIEGLNLDEPSSTNGCGKQEPINKIIPTPVGPTRFGDLKPGSLVFGTDGKSQKVTNIFPQNSLTTYKLNFTNGASVTCGPEHLWTFYSRYKCENITVSVKELLNMKEQEHLDIFDRTLRLPTIGVPEYVCRWSFKEMFLGSGPEKLGAVNGGKSDQRSCETNPGSIKGALEVFDFAIQSPKHERFAFMKAFLSAKERLVRKKTVLGKDKTWLQLFFFTKAYAIAYQQLAFSLCATADMHSTTEFGEKVWIVDSIFPNDPFRELSEQDYFDPEPVYLRSIEYYGEEDSMCITVENNDHLYLTENYIPTHNTTVVSALYWALTGNALTNEVLADDVINNKVKKDCRVILTLDTPQGEVVICRTRKDSELGNNLQLFLNEQDLSCHKVSDTQNRLNSLIKIPFELLHSTIIMTGDIRSAFAELTPQQRIHVLESIRDYSVWDNVRDLANDKIKAVNKKIQENNLQLSNYKGKQSVHEEAASKLLYDKEVLLRTFSREVLSTKKEELSARLDELTAKKDKLVKIYNLLDGQLNGTVKDDFQLQLDEITEAGEKAKEIHEKLNAELIRVSAEGKYKNQEFDDKIELLNKWFSEVNCPTCNRPLERTKQEIYEKDVERNNLINASLAFYKANQAEQKRLFAEIETARYEVGKYRYMYTEVNKKRKVYLEDTSERQREKDIASKNVRDCETEINKVTLELNNIVNTMNNFEEKVRSLEEKHATCLATLSSISTDLEGLEVENKKLLEEKAVSQYFYDLLGKNGKLRPYLLNKDIEYLNETMQKYIGRFFKNTDIQLKQEEGNINICILSQGVPKSVSSLSDGEKKRLNISIQLALYDLIQLTAQTNLNVLFLDEVETKLDVLGCNQLIEIIEDKSDEIESVFWLTNNPMVKDNIDDKIICKMSLGKTEIVT